MITQLTTPASPLSFSDFSMDEARSKAHNVNTTYMQTVFAGVSEQYGGATAQQLLKTVEAIQKQFSYFRIKIPDEIGSRIALTQMAMCNLITQKDAERFSRLSLSSFKTPSDRDVPASTAKSSQKISGLLVKPRSVSDGTLAVLIPRHLADSRSIVQVKNSQGTVIDTGRFVSFGDDGQRAKFSFRQQGSKYPKDAVIEVVTSGRTTMRLDQINLAKRLER